MSDGRLGSVKAYLLAVPTHVKFLGVVSLVLVGMGSVIILYVRHSLAKEAAADASRVASILASSLAARAERALVTGDLVALSDLLRREQDGNPDVRFALAFDSEGQVVAHGFRGEVPPGILRTAGPSPQRAIRYGGEVVFDSRALVLGGRAGGVRIGLGTRAVAERIDLLTRRFYLVLGLCLAFTLAIAAAVSVVMTRPLRRLVMATERIGDGDLAHREPLRAHDEVGELTAAINRMAERLQRQRDALTAKELERQALLDHVVLLQEEERRRIAQDLHDELGGSLAAMLIGLRDRRLQCLHAAEQSKDWERLEAQVRDLVRQVRRIAWSLRPSTLDDHGLGSALAQYVAALRDHQGVEIDFCGSTTAPERVRLPSSVELALYRLAQEAITNALRHAEATRISVVLLERPLEVVLVVEDDGRGFDPMATLSDRPHLGLLGMKERINSVCGRLLVESEPGHGTVVRAVVPIAGSGEDRPPVSRGGEPSRMGPDPGDGGARRLASAPMEV